VDAFVVDQGIRRRVGMIHTIAGNAVAGEGALLQAVARHELPEMSWAQLLASPEGQIINAMDARVRKWILDFVRMHTAENREFLLESARTGLRALWQFEIKLLEGVGNYAKLRKERSLGEMRMVDWSSVTYDNLGHYALAVMHPFPKWKAYVLEQHRPLLQTLAALGSHAARQLLGIDSHMKIEPLDDAFIADRFFFGDQAILQTLRKHYKG
jgi:hypothetical protein